MILDILLLDLLSTGLYLGVVMRVSRLRGSLRCAICLRQESSLLVCHLLIEVGKELVILLLDILPNGCHTFWDNTVGLSFGPGADSLVRRSVRLESGILLGNFVRNIRVVTLEQILQPRNTVDPVQTSLGVRIFVVVLIEERIGVQTTRGHEQEDDKAGLADSKSSELVLVKVTDEEVDVLQTMWGWSIDGFQLFSIHRVLLSHQALPRREWFEMD
mmetsp:Transcript_1274/g.1805  ORF Transcript_1274/g.1805 Transcript_1274/m.1805 type:complete len:216 (+) Transcript_1274:44-691(+)